MLNKVDLCGREPAQRSHGLDPRIQQHHFCYCISSSRYLLDQVSLWGSVSCLTIYYLAWAGLVDVIIRTLYEMSVPRLHYCEPRGSAVPYFIHSNSIIDTISLQNSFAISFGPEFLIRYLALQKGTGWIASRADITYTSSEAKKLELMASSSLQVLSCQWLPWTS